MVLLTQYEAARLVTGAQGAGTPIDWTLWINIAAAVAAGALLILLLRVRERRITRDPLGHAFERLARGMKLSRRQRARAAELAAARGVAPVGVLLGGLDLSAPG